MKAELEGITNALITERQRTDHTALIVGALTSAVNQFKNYRSPRMKQNLCNACHHLYVTYLI